MLAMKALDTSTLADKVRFLLFQLCELFRALDKGLLKFISKRSSRPKKAPRYLTGLESTSIPSTILLPPAITKAIVFDKFRCKPVKDPTSNIVLIVCERSHKFLRKIAVSSAYNKQGSPLFFYQSKSPWSHM